MAHLREVRTQRHDTVVVGSGIRAPTAASLLTRSDEEARVLFFGWHVKLSGVAANRADRAPILDSDERPRGAS